MYKVILADDEMHILMLLERLVDWKSLGIRIVGKYTDGQETFDAICEKRPDIVVTDIMMSGMTGLDIVRECIRRKIGAIFLLISGHAEFEYAHMAIQYGVENYLLKPIDRGELEDNLQRICARLNSEKLAAENQVTLENQIQFNRDILNGQFLSNMLFKPGWLTPASAPGIMRDYAMEFVEGTYRVLAIKALPRAAFTDDQLRLLLKQITHYSVKHLDHIVQLVIGTYTDAKAYLLIAYGGEPDIEQKVRLYFEHLRTRFFENCDLAIGMSGGAPDVFHASRAEAERALLERFNGGVNRLYEFDHLSPASARVEHRQFLDEFILSVETANADGVRNLFYDLGRVADDPALDVEGLLRLLEAMRDELGSVLARLYGGGAELRAIGPELSAVLEHAASKQDLLSGFRQYVLGELQKFSEEKSAEKFRHIRRAKEYIDAHLSENISLNDIASVVFMNPAYFSTLFKKSTGQNFSDYLVSRRVNRAKALLKDLSLSVSEVGEIVGYKNARYFSKIFLKELGIKPSEYRKMNLP